MNKSTCVVFWLENGLPMSESSPGADIGLPLKLCEALRKRAKAGESISHVCLTTESIDNVTAPGVSDKLPEGYDWMMRRRPFVPGRPSGGCAVDSILSTKT